jgi:hypothetical protein
MVVGAAPRLSNSELSIGITAWMLVVAATNAIDAMIDPSKAFPILAGSNRSKGPLASMMRRIKLVTADATGIVVP